MNRVQLPELSAFVAVAEHRSFTKVAAQMGIALPTMSQTIRSLEERLGVRLFNRTTRSVALTEAGQRLLAEIQPVLSGLDRAIETVNAFRDKPMGSLRIAVSRPAAAILRGNRGRPMIQSFLAEYPEIRLEVTIDDLHTDIVSAGFDAGIRIGHRVERDMTILRITDDFKVIAVAAPSYLARNPAPSSPADLHAHNFIQYRQPWDGSIQPWVLSQANGRQTEITVDGSLVTNDIDVLTQAMLDGIGIAIFAEPLAAPYLADGRLVRVLDGWSAMLPGVFLYHPSRRQLPMPLQVYIRFIEQWRRIGEVVV